MGDTTNPARLAAREYWYWFGAIGAACGSLALISLVQKVLKIGLAPLPAMIVDYYRSVIAPLREFLHWLMPITPPEWYVDLVVIGGLFAATFLRASWSNRNTGYERPGILILEDVLMLIFSIVASVLGTLTLLALLLPAFALYRGAGVWGRNTRAAFDAASREQEVAREALPPDRRRRFGFFFFGSPRNDVERRYVEARRKTAKARTAYMWSLITTYFFVSVLASAAACVGFFAWNFQAQ